MPLRKDAGVPAVGRQFDHVTIGVDSEETLMDLQERARKAGVQASDIVDHGFARAIYFEDPNGISLGCKRKRSGLFLAIPTSKKVLASLAPLQPV